MDLQTIIRDLKVRILGIQGSPVKTPNNTEYMLEEALKSAEAVAPGRVETEMIRLYELDIRECTGCDTCMRWVNKAQKQFGHDVTPVPMERIGREYNCSIEDDMVMVRRKMLETDGLVVAVPVYIATMPSRLKMWIDRSRTFIHDFRIRGRPCGCMSVAFYRNTGQDTTIQDVARSLMSMGYRPVSRGANTVSTLEGTGIPIKETRLAVSKDELGMYAVRTVGRKVALAALERKAGLAVLREVLGSELDKGVPVIVPGSR